VCHAALGVVLAGHALAAKFCDFSRLDGTAISTEEFRRRFRSEPVARPAVLTGLSLGPGFKPGKDASVWDPSVLSGRFGHRRVESQDAVVYRTNNTGKLARSGLGLDTTLGAILKAPDSTLFLLKAHHRAVAGLAKDLVVPAVLRPLQLTGPTLSLGGLNASSPFHQHPENWFAQLRGQKAWVVAPSGNSAALAALHSTHPCELARPRKPPAGVQRCVLLEGEVLYLPSQWAHGTCNLAAFGLGIGFIGSLDDLPELHLAAALGDAAGVAALARTARDLASPDHQGRRPLHWAAQQGHLRIAKQLMSHRADARAADARGASPLHLAAFEGHLPLVRALEKAAPGLAIALTFARAQPLHLAASRGHTAIVKHLLRRGAAPGARDSKGAEPLHMAAYEGHLAVAELLMAHGAAAHTTADDGTQPVHLARKRGHNLMVSRLGRSTPSKPSRREL